MKISQLFKENLNGPSTSLSINKLKESSIPSNTTKWKRAPLKTVKCDAVESMEISEAERKRKLCEVDMACILTQRCKRQRKLELWWKSST